MIDNFKWAKIESLVYGGGEVKCPFFVLWVKAYCFAA